MRQTAPVGLIVITMISFVLVNIVAAQAIIRVFYPGSGLQLGPAAFTVVGVVAAVSLFLVIRGWRAYLRQLPARK